MESRVPSCPTDPGRNRTDRRYGIKSWGLDMAHYSRSLDIMGYSPSLESHFDEALASLPIDAGEFTFIDYGCGKGTALIFALRARFKSVIGIEIVPEYAKAAQANLERFSRRNQDVKVRAEVMLGDATTLQLPDEPVLMYFSNPFGRKTLQAVMSNAKAACSVHKKSIFVIYLDPAHADVITAEGTFELLKRTDKWATFGTNR